MKKWLWFFAIIITIFLMLYAFAYFFVIPKTAEASLPYKWKNIPAGLKRNEYAIYLGKSSADENNNTWIKRDDHYIFSLTINYNADSTASSVELKYTFSNYLFHKEGVIHRNDE
jgi:hypothetical protein